MSVSVRSQRRSERRGLSINEVKDRVGIDQLLAYYGADLPSSYHGGWVSIRCPFHEDRVRSASVNYNKESFKCHGCDVHGDVIDVVRQVEGIECRGAILWIKDLLIS